MAEMNIPEPVCIQVWSLQGLSPERKAQYDAILANGEPLLRGDGSGSGLAEPRGEPEKITAEIEPWKSQLESIEFIKATAAKLRTFCTSTIRTARVRSILKDAKVIGNVPRHYGKHIRKSVRKPKV